MRTPGGVEVAGTMESDDPMNVSTLTNLSLSSPARMAHVTLTGASGSVLPQLPPADQSSSSSPATAPAIPSPVTPKPRPVTAKFAAPRGKPPAGSKPAGALAARLDAAAKGKQ